LLACGLVGAGLRAELAGEGALLLELLRERRALRLGGREACGDGSVRGRRAFGRASGAGEPAGEQPGEQARDCGRDEEDEVHEARMPEASDIVGAAGASRRICQATAATAVTA